jgi:hypothetical protein
MALDRLLRSPLSHFVRVDTLLGHDQMEQRITPQMEHEPRPLLSVIITADVRKEFLVSAVESVLTQDLGRSSFDVTVVKGFEDPAIDDFLASRSIRTVNFRHPNMGASLMAGIRGTTGEVISFLEDDDLWKPGKLRSVAHAFAEKGVVYYKDAHEPIDESGKALASSGYTRPRTRISVTNLKTDSRAIRSVLQARGDINLSSTSVSRSLLVRSEANALPLISAGPDWFMFYLALVSEGRMIFDNRALTFYRIHQSTVNPVNSALTAFVEQRRRLVARELESLSVMASTFEDPTVNSLIRGRIGTDKIQSVIVRERPTIDPRSREISPKTLVEVRKDSYGLTLLILFLIALTSPKTAQILYRALYSAAFL